MTVLDKLTTLAYNSATDLRWNNVDKQQRSTKKESNKEKILYAAMDVFAEKGYSGVTIREIAERVQIKAASIYNHYTGKEELLVAIVGYFRRHLQEETYPDREDMQLMDVSSFLHGSIAVQKHFFEEPRNTRIGQILLREQFHNLFIRKVLLEELMIKPRGMFTEYFAIQMEAGKLRRMDPAVLAKEYHAYFIYNFYENSLMLDAGQLDSESVQREQEEHVRLFLEHYCL